MTDLPRGKRPTPQERQRNIDRTGAGLGMFGGTRMAKAPGRPQRGTTRGGTITVVFHGDDGSVERPGVAVVYWVGAATPANGVDFDFWFVGDV